MVCDRLVLDVLTGQVSRDYVCVVKAGVDFESTVNELKSYFGFFRLQRHVTCETILRFYLYDGPTNYVLCRTGVQRGLQVDCPEFMVFCLVTLHLEGIEVLGTPVGNDRFIKTFVTQNCLKIMEDIGKHDCLTDGFVHTHVLKFCENTHTQYISHRKH
jgi:hypothetical protein